jgi:hypothetical protein
MEPQPLSYLSDTITAIGDLQYHLDLELFVFSIHPTPIGIAFSVGYLA